MGGGGACTALTSVGQAGVGDAPYLCIREVWQRASLLCEVLAPWAVVPSPRRDVPSYR